MKIVVEFDKFWTLEEIENFLANPQDSKYDTLADDEYLELVACAEYYATMRHYGNQNFVTAHGMNECAKKSIASGIEDHFFTEMYGGYCIYYMEQIDLHPEKPTTSPFENS